VAERGQLFKTIEMYLPQVLSEVTDGHGCVLRAICEVAKTPVNGDGIIGDLLTNVLTPLDHSEGNI
jgi:hypothetical protein